MFNLPHLNSVLLYLSSHFSFGQNVFSPPHFVLPILPLPQSNGCVWLPICRMDRKVMTGLVSKVARSEKLRKVDRLQRHTSVLSLGYGHESHSGDTGAELRIGGSW